MGEESKHLPKWQYFGVDLYVFFYIFVVFTLTYSKKIIKFLDFINIDN